MKTSIFFLCFLFFGTDSFAQQRDTLPNGIVLFKDFRMDAVAQRENVANTAALKFRAQFVKGYRIMILNTRDKEKAFEVRTLLLKNFPEQKPYMWYASPNIRIKFGNFATQEEAETYQKKINRLLNTTSTYLLNETIEINPGKDFDPESMREVTLEGLE